MSPQVGLKSLNVHLLIISAFLFACSSENDSQDSNVPADNETTSVSPSTIPASYNDDSALSLCAKRLDRDPIKLLEEIAYLTGKEQVQIATDASGTDGVNLIWDHSSSDVICTYAPLDPSGLNLIQQLNTGQLLYGSDASEYLGVLNGGTFIGAGGRDIVGTLKAGSFLGEEGADLVGSPLNYGIYNGWTYVSYSSDGMLDGRFFGGDGQDHVSQLAGGEFLGQDGHDSVHQLSGGSFFGGDGMDSISHPHSSETGLMTGGHFYGEGDSDWAERVAGGTVVGGDGNDLVESISQASFEGMSGDDTVFGMEHGANFHGGSGNDQVDSMSDGNYDGGTGIDRLEVYSDGQVVNVESLPPCLENKVNRAKCLISN